MTNRGVESIETSHTSFSTIRKSVRFWIVASFVTFFILVLSLAPIGMSYVIKQWLLSHGGDVVSLKNIDFNPFTGRALFQGLSVSVDNREVLSLTEARVKFGWFPLIRKKAVIEEVFVSGLDISIEELSDKSWRIGGIRQDLTEGETDNSDSTSDDALSPPSSPWGVGLWLFSMEKSNVRFHGMDIEAVLQVDNTRITRVISWERDNAAVIEFKGAFNKAPLQIRAEAAPFAETFRLATQVKLTGLTLDDFAVLAKSDLSRLSGIVDVDFDMQVKLSKDRGIDLVQKGALSLQQVHVTSSDADIEAEKFMWSGMTHIAMSSSGEEIEVDGNGDVTGDKIVFVQESENITGKKGAFSWSGKVGVKKKKGEIDAVFDGDFLARDIEFQGDIGSVKEDLIEWKGSAEYTTVGEDVALTLSAKGRLGSGPLSVQLSEQGVDLDQSGINWEGSFLLEGKENPPSSNIKAVGKITGGEVALKVQKENLRYKHSGIMWDGLAELSTQQTEDGMKEGIHIQGDFSANSIDITSLDETLSLIGIGDLSLKGLDVTGPDAFDLATLDLRELHLLNNPVEEKDRTDSDSDRKIKRTRESLLSLNRIEMVKSEIRLPNSFRIDSLQIDGAKAFIRRTGEGDIDLVKDALAFMEREVGEEKKESTPEAVVETPAADSPASLNVYIGKAEMTGESSVRFEDMSVSPPFLTQVDFTEMSIWDIDNTTADKSIKFSLAGKSGKYSDLSFKGDVTPFDEKISLNLVSEIRGFDMLSLSPYTVSMIGYGFTSGEMSADIDVKVDKGVMDGETKLKLLKLHVAPDETAANDGKKGKLSIPLETALGVLRKKDDSIQLNVPISGNIDDPDFDLSHAINTALGKAASAAAVGYLSYALQPFGAIVTAARIAGSMAMRVRLDPVFFDSGKKTLNNSSMEYLDKVSKILNDRKEISLQVCGRATADDRAALLMIEKAKAESLKKEKTGQQKKVSANGGKVAVSKEQPPVLPPITDEQLLSIAKERAFVVKDILIEKHGIDSGRLISCKPEIDSDTKDKPRVELLI